jgi:hypothetical protein
VQHARFTLATLAVSGVDVPLLVGDLVVVRHEGTAELDWELVATSPPVQAYAQEPHQLTMVVLADGRTLTGDAVVVRSDEQRHVFRGMGPLDGLRADDLPPVA